MRRCPNCGHHHGTWDHHWPTCQAINEDDDGGIRRCHCTNPDPHHTT